MSERLQWWVLPGAILVLLRVVTLDEPQGAPPRAAVAASAAVGAVAVLEASGHRTGPVAIPAPVTGGLVVSVPDMFLGQRGDLTLWRRVDGRCEATPWLVLRPRVRGDATIAIAGLGRGRYDVELRFDTLVLRAEDVAAPGTVVLTPVEPEPPR